MRLRWGVMSRTTVWACCALRGVFGHQLLDYGVVKDWATCGSTDIQRLLALGRRTPDVPDRPIYYENRLREGVMRANCYFYPNYYRGGERDQSITHTDPGEGNNREHHSRRILQPRWTRIH